MLSLKKDHQHAKDCHEDDTECLSGDGNVAPRPHRDGGRGDAVDEHQDQVVVIAGNVTFDICPVEGADWSHRLPVNSGAYGSEDEGSDSQNDDRGSEPCQRDEAEGGVEFDAEVEEGREEEEVFEREELQCHPEGVVDLLKKVDQFFHLLPQGSQIDPAPSTLIRILPR